MTEDKMVGWLHRLCGRELWQLDGQGSLACCSPWGRKELNTTEQPNWFSTLNTVCGPVFEDIMSQSSGLG